MENFSERLIRLRKENGLSQEQLGSKIGLKRSAIHKMEKGLTINPKRSTVEKLAKVFGVSGSYILCMTDNKEAIDEEVTAKAFANEVKALLNKTDGLTEQQKKHILNTLEFICSDEE
jgi:transcriptional regulator with XRE-family HTH domain